MKISLTHPPAPPPPSPFPLPTRARPHLVPGVGRAVVGAIVDFLVQGSRGALGGVGRRGGGVAARVVGSGAAAAGAAVLLSAPPREDHAGKREDVG